MVDVLIMLAADAVAVQDKGGGIKYAQLLVILILNFACLLIQNVNDYTYFTFSPVGGTRFVAYFNLCSGAGSVYLSRNTVPVL